MSSGNFNRKESLFPPTIIVAILVSLDKEETYHEQHDVTVQDLAKKLFFDPAWRDMVPAWRERSLIKKIVLGK